MRTNGGFVWRKGKEDETSLNNHKRLSVAVETLTLVSASKRKTGWIGTRTSVYQYRLFSGGHFKQYRYCRKFESGGGKALQPSRNSRHKSLSAGNHLSTSARRTLMIILEQPPRVYLPSRLTVEPSIPLRGFFSQLSLYSSFILFVSAR